MATKSNNAEIAVLQDWRSSVDKTLERIEAKIDDLDEKFAAKWVQSVVAGLIAAILLSFLGALFYFVYPRHVDNSTDVHITTPVSESNSPASTPSQPTQSKTEADAKAVSSRPQPTPGNKTSSSTNRGLNGTVSDIVEGLR